MKKILLINPAWKFENEKNIWRKLTPCYPSLGLAYIAAVLEQDKHEVIFLDMPAEDYIVDDVKRLIDNGVYKGIDYVGITATSPLLNCAYELASLFKQRNPEVIVVLGGTHPTVLPEEVLQNGNVDVVVMGEGEITMQELVNGKDLSDIPGVAYRKGSKVVRNKPRPVIEDLDVLPLPAYHLMPIRKYRPATGSYKKLPAMSIFATRGCPGKCTFCNRSFSGRVRSRSAKKIIEEIKILQRDYGIKEINFYDDTFTALKSNVAEFCNMLIAEKIDITWSCFTRVNYVDKDLFSLMKKSGCHQVMMGIESGVQEVLDGMNKMVTVGQIRNAVKICKEVGLETRASYLVGNIGETKDQMEYTLVFAKQLDTDYAQFNILTAYPGTVVWDEAARNGWLRVKDYSYNLGDFTLEMPWISREELLDFQQMAHKGYYLRPKVIMRRILKLRSIDQIKQEFRGALAVILQK